MKFISKNKKLFSPIVLDQIDSEVPFYIEAPAELGLRNHGSNHNDDVISNSAASNSNTTGINSDNNNGKIVGNDNNTNNNKHNNNDFSKYQFARLV